MSKLALLQLRDPFLHRILASLEFLLHSIDPVLGGGHNVAHLELAIQFPIDVLDTTCNCLKLCLKLQDAIVSLSMLCDNWLQELCHGFSNVVLHLKGKDPWKVSMPSILRESVIVLFMNVGQKLFVCFYVGFERCKLEVCWGNNLTSTSLTNSWPFYGIWTTSCVPGIML